MKSYLLSEYLVQVDGDRCTLCLACVVQCTYGVFSHNRESRGLSVRSEKCVNCHRCVIFCPVQAIAVVKNPTAYRENFYWAEKTIRATVSQAEKGGILLAGMGCDTSMPVYWDKLLLNASQVTNPSIDPLREPVELRTYLGSKPDRLEVCDSGDGPVLETAIAPQLTLETPILFAAMSYGAISLEAQEALAQAALEFRTLFNAGEGGLHKRLYPYGGRCIVQVASARFGVHIDYLNAAAGIEVKIGQGAKPGIGGHLPGEKVTREVSETRMIPEGTDALSPAPHHDIYSIEDLRQLIYALKEATDYVKPVFVKIAAVHNSAAIASGIVRAGADAVVIDGMRGATGAAPLVVRDNVGIPLELALAAVDQRLRDEGIRNRASIIVGGGIRNSADVVKAIALGADAVYIGTAALVAMGCSLCQKCYTGKCPWGIATTDLEISKRLSPDTASRRLINLLQAWSLEIKMMLGGMGMNSVESLRGNRLHLRGVGLTEGELKVLGVKMAGE
ncbi:glutamate synthase-related protein [Candidatus Hecatella orcuttiae]|jgi:glutamate synthase domain-containing protein 2|uniref:glutamate synthase-related protein n=1 Tax=Candidatus Hecatella orcuttiae TaxID=1935119 RepID=UPI002867B854|nr:glutamate synthase-related protein [Candidatus Hecatella orcuttiae]